MTTYEDFIASKTATAPHTGLATVPPLSPLLFPFQADIASWALRLGRAAIFADTGLGKTAMSLEWAKHVAAHTDGRVLILAPLAVAAQTIREGERVGVHVTRVREAEDVTGPGVYITNYDRLHKIDPADFAGVVADESSIIKASDGATTKTLIETFARTPFKLACTATPSPNDHLELGTHAEFLGVMSRQEMLATFFCHDGGETQVWRLKGHAEAIFWRWVASWACMIRRPSDIGYDDAGYALPPLTIQEHVMVSGVRVDGQLFAESAETLAAQREARKATLAMRVAKVAELVAAEPNEAWLVWCELNAEGNALEKAIPGAVQVAGADDADIKESRLLGFATGAYRILVSKPSLAGFGLNYQHAARMAFVGVSHSYEQFYQGVRREYRFGQKREVHVHIVSTDIESAVLENVKRKQAAHEEMASAMVGHMSATMRAAIRGTVRQSIEYAPAVPMLVPEWCTTDSEGAWAEEVMDLGGEA